MDLEERTLETVGEHCEECGAKLTDAELKAAMESGGPALCTVHAAETTALDAEAMEEPRSTDGAASPDLEHDLAELAARRKRS